ncbi:hypothetical protein [Enterococcus sp. DIV0691]|uniref:hypothetical protein n=1 Tax=Enterococcus sp. DIV0691 TaxID=2774703 RepID=UPI003F1F9FF5
MKKGFAVFLGMAFICLSLVGCSSNSKDKDTEIKTNVTESVEFRGGDGKSTSKNTNDSTKSSASSTNETKNSSSK